MEFTKKGKILRKYGKGLAKSFFEDARREFENSSQKKTGILERLKIKVEGNLELFEENLSQEDLKKIIKYMAEGFLEIPVKSQAYSLYKRINAKESKIMEIIFPKNYLEDL